MKLTRMTGLIISLGCILGLTGQSPRRIAPAGIPVRFPEGSVHAFLALSSAQGKLLANGDLLQLATAAGIESKMVFRFADSSYFEESVKYSQLKVFALQSYRLVQRGAAFEADLDATFSADGKYSVKSTSHEDRKTKEYHGTLELPPDVSNGMAITLLKNMVRHDTQTVHMIAFMPAPKVVGLQISPVREALIKNGTRNETTVEYDLKPKPGAVAGFFGKLLGKIPADTHVWIVITDVPAFLKSEGPLYTGPVWRIALETLKN